ncbi:hypothetical protein BDF22DRAFT_470691 [Syncephalis plumigaleata]|nr:hypothetical protein BDF22DRAFT_470691 [Syncephalis plumigaleata]
MDTNKRTSISNKKSSKQASSSSSLTHDTSQSSQSAQSLRKQRISKRVALSSGDIVWAKMPGFPWFPAELVQPSKSIPDSVMNYREPNKDRLVCFFDKHMKQRSWQWLATKDLQPLGRDDTIDLRHLKLTDYRRDKRRIRLSVKAAYIAACEAMTEENGQPVDPQRLLSQLK